MSPGPDCFIVMQTAIGRSRKEALCCVLGITLGVAFWAALSLLGLQWLFEQFAWLQQLGLCSWAASTWGGWPFFF